MLRAPQGDEGAEEHVLRGDRPDDDEVVARELGTSKTRSSDTSIFDLRPPARQFIPVPVDAHLIEDTHTPLVVEVQTQTDVFLPRPATPPYVPLKTGIDASTQARACAESQIACDGPTLTIVLLAGRRRRQPVRFRSRVRASRGRHCLENARASIAGS